MSGNFSSVFNDSLPQHLSPTHSYITTDMYCFLFRPTSFIFVTFYSINLILVLPLCMLIIYYGLREWNKKPSTGTMSHSDCFTYHVVAIEMIGVFRCIGYWYGIYTDDLKVIFIGGLFSSFTWNGESLFHVLTCVERYLAVVHPITYLSLKNKRGIKIRNIITACVWLLCFAGTGLFVIQEFFVVINFGLLIFHFSVIAFCSASVLCVLVRPIPGKQATGKDRVDQSKRRAFYTMLVILGVLGMRFCGSVIWGVLFVSGENNECVIMASLIWVHLPNSLVLPLLYLHRAGKLACCKKSVQ